MAKNLKNREETNSRKKKARMYAERVILKYNLAPDTHSNLSTQYDDDESSNWQARGDIKRAYREQEAKWVKKAKPYTSKRQGWNRKGPIARRY